MGILHDTEKITTGFEHALTLGRIDMPDLKPGDIVHRFDDPTNRLEVDSVNGTMASLRLKNREIRRAKSLLVKTNETETNT